MIKKYFYCMNESKAEVQEKMNINRLIENNFINKYVCTNIYLFNIRILYIFKRSEKMQCSI